MSGNGLRNFQRKVRGQCGAVTFDKGRSQNVDPEQAAGFAPRAIPVFSVFRNRETDRQPIREVVTARLMGDPNPDRVVPDIPESRHGHKDEPAPIYLTFREMRAAYGIEE